MLQLPHSYTSSSIFYHYILLHTTWPTWLQYMAIPFLRTCLSHFTRKIFDSFPLSKYSLGYLKITFNLITPFANFIWNIFVFYTILCCSLILHQHLLPTNPQYFHLLSQSHFSQPSTFSISQSFNLLTKFSF